MNHFNAIPTIRIVLKGMPPKEFSSGRVIIGRSDKAHFIINGDEISREHVEITATGGVLWIKDLGSSNGTYVDGKKLSAKKPFRSGQFKTIRLGKKILINIALVMEGVQTASENKEDDSVNQPLPLENSKSKNTSSIRKISITSSRTKIPSQKEDKSTSHFLSSDSSPNSLKSINSSIESEKSEGLSELSIHLNDDASNLDSHSLGDHATSSPIAESNVNTVGTSGNYESSEPGEILPNSYIEASNTLGESPKPIKTSKTGDLPKDQQRKKAPTPTKNQQTQLTINDSSLSITSNPTVINNMEPPLGSHKEDSDLPAQYKELVVLTAQPSSQKAIVSFPEASPKPISSPVTETEEYLLLAKEYEVLQNENTRLQTEVESLGLEIRSLMEREANLPQKIAEAEKRLANTQERLYSVEKELEGKIQSHSEELRKYELWKENSALEAKRSEIDLEAKRKEIDLDSRSLQLVIQELKSKKQLFENELSVIERTRNHILSEIEGLRKNEREASLAVKAALNRQQQIESEYKEITDSTEDAKSKNLEVISIIEATEAKLSALEAREKNMQTELTILKSEAARIKESTASERHKILEDARDAARKESEKIHKIRNKETEQQVLELRTKAELEISQRYKEAETQHKAQMQKIAEEIKSAQDELDRFKKDSATEMMLLDEEHERIKNQKIETLNKILEEKRTSTEKEIGERLAVTRREIDLMLEKEGRESHHRRASQIKEISANLEKNIGMSLDKMFRNLEIENTELSLFLKDINRLVESAFLPNDPKKTSQKAILSIDPDTIERNRVFWQRFIYTMIGLVAVVGLGTIYFKDIKRHVVSHLPLAEDNEFVQKAARDLAEKSKFNPIMDSEYKNNYVDNVLYTKEYMHIKLDEGIQKEWVLELNKFFINELHLDDRVIVKFFSLETNLIRKLAELRGFINPSYEKQSITRMRAEESSIVPEFVKLLGDESNYQKFKAFERKFYFTVSNNRPSDDTLKHSEPRQPSP